MRPCHLAPLRRFLVASRDRGVQRLRTHAQPLGQQPTTPTPSLDPQVGDPLPRPAEAWRPAAALEGLWTNADLLADLPDHHFQG